MIDLKWNNQRLRVGFQNVNGLSGKAEATRTIMETAQLDILFIAESWLSTTATNPLRDITFTDIRGRKSLNGRRVNGGILGLCKCPRLKQAIRSQETNNTVTCTIGQVTIMVGYFSPKKEFDKPFEAFIESAMEINDCLVMGDFNAHHIKLGSNHTNPRGTWLWDNLDKLNYCHPERGFHSSTIGLTRPDHVLTSGAIFWNDLIIHDEINTLSDHKVLSLSMNMPEFTSHPFERLAIGKTRNKDVKEQYSKALTVVAEELHAELDRMPWPMGKDEINDLWKLVKTKVYRCLEEVVGIFQYKPRVNQEFWSPKLKELNEAMQIIKDVARYGRETREMLEALKYYQSKFDIEMQKQKEKIYQKYAESLEQGELGAFLRMVNCSTARDARSKCMLDPLNIEKDKVYFESTFGHPPEGSGILIYDDALQETIPGKWFGHPIPENRRVTWRHVHDVTKWMQNGKAPGIDDLPSEAWKVLLPEIEEGIKVSHPIYEVLARFFTILMESCLIPEEWQIAIIVPVYKKNGDVLDIRNYRPIALTVVVRRIYEQIIAKFLMPQFERHMRPQQNGFRPERSTIQHADVLDQLCSRYPRLIKVFLDIKAAYDTVDRRILWGNLVKKFGLHPKWVAILRSLFDYNKVCLRVKGRTSSEVNCLRGLLQGSSLSPVLFNAFINLMIERIEEFDTKVAIHGIRTNSLWFADDAVLLCEKLEDAQRLLDYLGMLSTAMGFRFAPQKCVILARPQSTLKLYNDVIPQCDSFKYLGIIFDNDGIVWTETMKKPMKKAKTMTTILRKRGFNGKGWTPRLSILAYKSFIRSSMEYGLALRLIPAPVINDMESIQMKSLKIAFSVAQQTSNLGLLTITGMMSMKERNVTLNARYLGMLRNSIQTNCFAVRSLQNKCLVGNMDRSTKNAIWPKLIKRNLILAASDVSQQDVKLLKSENATITRQWFCNERYRQLKKESTSVAGALLPLGGNLSSLNKPSQVLYKVNTNSRQERNDIILWMLGRVALHQYPCNRCGADLSRIHAVACSERKFNFNEIQDMADAFHTSQNNSRYTLVDFCIQATISKNHHPTYTAEHFGISLNEFRGTPEYKKRQKQLKKLRMEKDQEETRRRLGLYTL
jgi:hypothetical protein